MKCFQSFRLDTANHCLWRGEERVSIAPKAYDVLRYLVENPGRLVEPDELLEKLWPDTFVNPEILRKYILDIRKILGDRHDKPVFIETVTKRGYRFVAPVSDDSAVEPPGVSSPPVNEAQTQPETQAIETPSDRLKLRKIAILPMLALIAAVAVAAVGYFFFARNRTHATPLNNTSIAVLPFSDLSPGKDQEYFSDGLTEQLINDLAKVPGLKVVARSSAFQFKGENEDLRSVGRKLGVANILEGSVRKEGNRVRITAELTKSDDGFQIWSQTYDREVNHIFAVQDEIAQDVTGALQLTLLSARNTATPTNSHATNPEAYQAYLQGQYFIARGQDQDDLHTALSYAEQAIKLDPSYAPAWAQRSLALDRLARVALIDPSDGFSRARTSAEKAIALDPGLAEGYMALALVQVNHDWDWDGARVSLKEAADLEPGSAAVRGNQAYLARILGHTDEAIGLYNQAIALDPLRSNYYLALGYELYFAGRYNEALGALKKAQALNPQLSSLHLTRTQVFLLQGHSQKALEEIALETGEWEKLSGESLAYYAAGRRQYSESALAELIARYQNNAAYQIAEAYAYRGETDKAFQWLDRAFRQRDPGVPEMKSNPLMKRLRQDPRFAKLLTKMGLPR